MLNEFSSDFESYWGSTTLSLMYEDVDLFLCAFSFRENLYMICSLSFDMILDMD